MNREEIEKFAKEERELLRKECPTMTDEQIEEQIQALVKQAKAINNIKD